MTTTNVPSLQSFQTEDSDFSFEETNHAECSFPPELFESIMHNLIKNPNITSSHLFRADILYDSERDLSYHAALLLAKGDNGHPVGTGQVSRSLSDGKHEAPSAEFDRLQVDPSIDEPEFGKHMQLPLRPRMVSICGFQLRQTVVRELIPRNPQLDRPLVQTCHFYASPAEPEPDELGSHRRGENMTLVVYLPHVDDPSHMPWYHPTVSSIAFLHTWRPPDLSDTSTEQSQESGTGTLSIHVAHYPSTTTSDEIRTRTTRTLQNLQSTILRHGIGTLRGYMKRVHHDQLIPQARFQNTYTRLKLRHARPLVDSWREVTDPTKHVFEDLGIAAFLLELWRAMYGVAPEDPSRDAFPGFVDIGCGNGLLVHILAEEGYTGIGIDIRARKSWAGYPASTQARLRAETLVPAIFSDTSPPSPPPESRTLEDMAHADTHDGIFPPGTFLISNHADELTCWTPLLAYLSSTPVTPTPWLAIPCCSHDVSGARTRFTPRPAHANLAATAGLRTDERPVLKHAAETGSLGRRPEPKGAEELKGKTAGAQDKSKNKGKGGPLSAYATLCDRVEDLAAAVGYVTEREMLRIPSTRNVGIVGRGRIRRDDEHEGFAERLAVVTAVIEKEMHGHAAEELGRAWMERADILAKGKGSGH